MPSEGDTEPVAIKFMGSLLLLALGLATFAACGDDHTARPTAVTATADPPVATATRSSAPPPIADKVPAPPPRGAACPLDADLCAVAGKIEAWVVARDAAGLLAASQGTPHTCLGNDHRDACAGAPEGAVRTAFSFGEALLGTAAFQLQATKVLNDLSLAKAADIWGPPGPHVGAVGCIRAAAGAANHCDDRSLQVSVTLIGRFNGLGIEERRAVYEVLLHRESGQLWVHGIGLAVPPLVQLYAFDIPASIDGAPATLMSRPWLP